MARAAVRQQDGLQERRPAKGIDVVHVHGRCLEQESDDLDMTSLGRRDQRHAPESVRDGRVRAGLIDGPETLQQLLL